MGGDSVDRPFVIVFGNFLGNQKIAVCKNRPLFRVSFVAEGAVFGGGEQGHIAEPVEGGLMLGIAELRAVLFRIFRQNVFDIVSVAVQVIVILRKLLLQAEQDITNDPLVA